MDHGSHPCQGKTSISQVRETDAIPVTLDISSSTNKCPFLLKIKTWCDMRDNMRCTYHCSLSNAHIENWLPIRLCVEALGVVIVLLNASTSRASLTPGAVTVQINRASGGGCRFGSGACCLGVASLCWCGGCGRSNLFDCG